MALKPPTTSEDNFPELDLKVEEVRDLSTTSTSTALEELPAPSSEIRLEIGEKAHGWVENVKSLAVNSPEYNAKIREISTIGNKEVFAAVDNSNRMLNRASSSLAGAVKGGGEASIKVASSLGELRSTIQDLSPTNTQKGFRKILSVIPGGKKINKYFQRYESAQEQLNGIIANLKEGKSELESDVQELEQEKANQWKLMLSLRDNIHLVGGLRDEIVSAVVDAKANGNIDVARGLEVDMLYVVNQRLQDLTTQLTVASQGYMAMELIRSNNAELIKGVERAESTTLVALRTSVIVAQALGQQKSVLDSVDAINEATNKMIVQTGQNLKSQTERVHKQASSSGVDPAALARAYDDITATVNNVDNFKIVANEQMINTVNILTRQIEKNRPQLERMRSLDEASKASSDLSTLDFSESLKSLD